MFYFVTLIRVDILFWLAVFRGIDEREVGKVIVVLFRRLVFYRRYVYE